MTTEVRILTVTQPWASLIAFGAKTVETRSWSTPYRGLIAIRAAKTFSRETPRAYCAGLCQLEPFATALADGGADGLDDLPLGAVVAFAQLQQVVSTTAWPVALSERCDGSDEWHFGDYSPGRYGWLLGDVVRLEEPLVCDGGLGLRRAPAAVAELVAAPVRGGHG